MNANDWLTFTISLAAAIVLVTWVIARQLTASRQARAELTAGAQYRDLADEYRRLSDVAITAQEHLDLRLTDLSVRIDELRDKMEQMQHILKEVE
jgi:phage shock protein A